MKKPQSFFWTEEELDLLGKISDKEMSKRFGRALKSIAKKRERLGIRLPNERWITDAQKALLGTMTDDALAVKCGLSVLTIKKWRRKFRIPPLKLRKTGGKKKPIDRSSSPATMEKRLRGKKRPARSSKKGK